MGKMSFYPLIPITISDGETDKNLLPKMSWEKVIQNEYGQGDGEYECPSLDIHMLENRPNSFEVEILFNWDPPLGSLFRILFNSWFGNSTPFALKNTLTFVNV
jgi:hypothetical protein